MKYQMCNMLAVVVGLLIAGGAAAAHDFSGQVVDAKTGAGIAGAVVTVGSRVVATDSAGQFSIDANSDIVRVRAAGYMRQDRAAAALSGTGARIRLTAFAPKALYLSFYGIGNAKLRNAALSLIRSTELNAVVIDIKGDRGFVPYRSRVPLATEIGAQHIITIPDLGALLRSFHEDGIYTIARIVAFKDDPLGAARPDLAVKTANGVIYRDREGLRWVDPTSREVWNYNIAIAEEAARAGFDEIQFDYLRFPDSAQVHFPPPNTVASRTQAIGGFLETARQRLVPYNVFLAVDVFGYICWNVDDTRIGQRLEDILPRVDYLSPMLYPSGFQFGIPGYRNPVAHAYEIVRHSLDRVRERTNASPLRLRPWLQAFRDYAFDRRQFGADEIRLQVRAAEEFGSNGWMLWNPANVYPSDGFEAKVSCS